MLVDTHAHVQFSGFKDEADSVMQRSLDAGMVVINVGSQIDTSTEAVKMLESYPERVYAVVGLHPEHTYQHLVDEEESHFRTREEKFDYEAYKTLAINPKVVGIGECGLDYYRFEEGSDIAKIKEQQRLAFDQQIKLALELDKALVVHCRPSNGTVDAYEDLVSILSEIKQQNSQLRFEVHCFTGTLEVAKQFVALGGYLGLNGIITFDKTGISEEVVKNISLDNIILETDCPYLTPAPFRGKRNEPLYVKYVAEKISEWKNIPFEEVETKTTENAEKLFKLNL
jgi:TatD DNase family protein